MLLSGKADTEQADSSQGGLTALIAASEHGDAACIKMLLEHGALIETSDDTGLSPLLAAARLGHSEAVGALVEAGASTSIRHGVTALADYKSALSKLESRMPHLQCLSRARHGPDCSPLFVTAVAGHGAAVGELVARSAATEPADTRCVMELAREMGHAEVTALILDELQGAGTLQGAINAQGVQEAAVDLEEEAAAAAAAAAEVAETDDAHSVAKLCSEVSQQQSFLSSNGLIPDLTAWPASVRLHECVLLRSRSLCHLDILPATLLPCLAARCAHCSYASLANPAVPAYPISR